MAKPKKIPSSSLTLQLSAGEVSVDLGIIRECTVAKADVQAQGHVVFLDKAGNVTRDEKLAVKKLPVFTDAKFLETLMTAAKKAGPRVKAREDHDDSIGARAGFFESFRLTTDKRVVADMHLFAAYRNKSVVLETAEKTPEEIGLSIDYVPSFEIDGDRALMRCDKLLAVDIVDQGAITPGGLFLSAGVDTEEKKETTDLKNDEPSPAMPDPKDDKKSPTNEEIMSALGALTKTVGECVAMMNAAKAGAAAAAGGGDDSEGMKAVRKEQERLAAELKSQSEKLAVVTQDNVKLKRERLLMGLPAGQREKLSAASVEDVEKAAAAGAKSYDQLVDEEVEKMKASGYKGMRLRSEAGQRVRLANRDAYAESLKARGIFDPAKVKKVA